MDGTPVNLVSLVERAKEGDKSSLEELIALFQKDIFRMIYHRTRSRMDAEDLTQETFIKASQNIHTLNHAEFFKPWLFRIAIHKVNDFYRKNKILSLFHALPLSGEHEVSPSKTNPGALEHVMQQEFWRKVESFLSKLSRLEREVFQLRFMEHLNIREISQTLKKSESTIKTLLYRSLKKFKQETSLHEILERKDNEK